MASFAEQTLPIIPGRASDHGPDGNEPERDVKYWVEMCRDALCAFDKASKRQFLTEYKRECLAAIREAQDALDAAENWLLALDR